MPRPKKLTKAEALTKLYKCKKCKQPKLGIEFHSDKSSYRGLGRICKECASKEDDKRKKYLCPECNKRTNVINNNQLCPKCNLKFGLIECIKCKELKFALVDFNDKKRVCDDCEDCII